MKLKLLQMEAYSKSSFIMKEATEMKPVSVKIVGFVISVSILT
jgi:hypothetical protein